VILGSRQAPIVGLRIAVLASAAKAYIQFEQQKHEGGETL